MNHGPLIFVGLLFALACSWAGMVLAPQLQLGRQQPVVLEETGQPYPPARPGLAQQGAEVYRALGCNHCHSQQVRQEGVDFDLQLTSVGEQTNDVVGAVQKLKPLLAAGTVEKYLEALPAYVVRGVSWAEADRARKQLEAVGAKLHTVVVPRGADLERGWGRRLTVARDYLHDRPVMLGWQRLGPDLANIGSRAPEKFVAPWRFQTATNHTDERAAWHLLHLYNPQIKSPGSTMPAYSFLFETRRVGREPSPDALPLAGGFAAPAGQEVVPRHGARALVAYLLSLQAEVPLFEAPVAKPATAAPPPPAAAAAGAAPPAP